MEEVERRQDIAAANNDGGDSIRATQSGRKVGKSLGHICEGYHVDGDIMLLACLLGFKEEDPPGMFLFLAN